MVERGHVGPGHVVVKCKLASKQRNRIMHEVVSARTKVCVEAKRQQLKGRTEGLKIAYKRMRAPPVQSFTFMDDGTGRITSSPTELGNLLRRAWSHVFDGDCPDP
eukprot:628359-Alexandrium_andersonii.AAC.1